MACQGRRGMRDEISQEAKHALANAAKVRRMRRLNRDVCSKSDAVRRRLRYIAAERNLEPADIAKIIMRRLRLDDLAGFAHQKPQMRIGPTCSKPLASSTAARAPRLSATFKRRSLFSSG